MSLMKTKPKYCKFAEASNLGWINGKTGELLISFRNLKSLLEAEQKADQPVVQTVVEVVAPAPVVEVIQVKEEIVMKTEEKVEVRPVEVKPVMEQTSKKLKKNQKIIAEVVEHDLDNKEVIGE